MSSRWPFWRKPWARIIPAWPLPWNNLASLLKDNGDHERALPLYERSLAIKEKAVGKDHPDTATSLNNLAKLYRDKGDYDRALLLYERSLAIREKALGKKHPHVAQSLNNLALLNKVKGDHERPCRCISSRWPSWRKPSVRIIPT